MNPSPINYRIDASDRIVSVSPSWSEFAEANLGQDSLPEQVIGRKLWSFVGDETTRELYRRMIARARSGHAVQFRYRCDAPAERRVFAMRISAVSGDVVEFHSQMVSSEARSPVDWLNRAAVRSRDFVVMCGWCARVSLSAGHWVEIEQAIEQHRAFQGAVAPRITHSICPECLQRASRFMSDEPADGRQT
ncbi:MAG TPA: PAS domain-containing protein [Lacunisphaera sp.]|nr:PAS domain-containing protein [Lacunisphaera sp.]